MEQQKQATQKPIEFKDSVKCLDNNLITVIFSLSYKPLEKKVDRFTQDISHEVTTELPNGTQLKLSTTLTKVSKDRNRVKLTDNDCALLLKALSCYDETTQQAVINRKTYAVECNLTLEKQSQDFEFYKKISYILKLWQNTSITIDRTVYSNIIDTYAWSNCTLYIKFNQSFIEQLLTDSYITYLPKASTLISTQHTARHPHYYTALLHYLAKHYNNASNRNRNTNNIIRVSTVFKSCFGYSIDEITNDKYTYEFNKLVNLLNCYSEQGILTWKFCGAKKLQLTELEQEKGSKYKLNEYYIYFEFC